MSGFIENKMPKIEKKIENKLPERFLRGTSKVTKNKVAYYCSNVIYSWENT